MTVEIGILLGFFLAYANGANDNFKGVATLYGSHTASHKVALLWATATTFLGSVVALLLAKGLLAAFSGKGLVSPEILSMHRFALTLALGSALTVFIATRIGMPISTTHSIIGSLIGAGFIASLISPTAALLNLSHLGSTFLIPMLISPILAITLAYILYPLCKKIRRNLGISKESCICIGNKIVSCVPADMSNKQALAEYANQYTVTDISIDTPARCADHYTGKFLGLSVKKTVDNMHFLSSGIVSFARGLNDTPKIAAILIMTQAIPSDYAIIGVAIAIALGGWISSKKVAYTLSHEITTITASQGLKANMITSFIVIFASKFGIPVSTTHVSCGALFGIGIVTKQAKYKMIKTILAPWLTTLPFAAGLSALLYLFFNFINL